MSAPHTSPDHAATAPAHTATPPGDEDGPGPGGPGFDAEALRARYRAERDRRIRPDGSSAVPARRR